MARHPDLIELRERYDKASAAPVAEILQGLTLLTAIFLAASPWIVGFNSLATITVTDLIAGGALAVLTLSLSASYGRLHSLGWVVPVIGFWTIIAPWSVAGAVDVTRTIWSNFLTGGAILVFGALMALFAVRRTRRSGG